MSGSDNGVSGAYPTGPGDWLRCQLHCHTTNSDGDASPAELLDAYTALGFDAVAITDHWHVTRLDSERLISIPGSELSSRSPSPTGEAEALAIGVDRLPDAREPFDSIEAMARWIAGHGGYPILCHPYWSGMEPSEVAGAGSLGAVEVWNGGSQLLQGNGLSSVHWDAASHGGHLMPGIATDDCHTPPGDCGLAWTWVLAAERTAAAVVAGLRAGRCYGSNGPRIEAVRVDRDGVLVRCSSARTVRLRSGPWDGCAAHADGRGDWRGAALRLDEGGLLVEARLQYPEFWRWARVEVEDDRGGVAWGPPFRLPGDEPGLPPGYGA
ncbi:MAG TPA: CehA/McbA family metallohydrolase [Gaiellales bacterium]|nr:CehA/McbA family metallohydrolase [Gaiellales bacterium]